MVTTDYHHFHNTRKGDDKLVISEPKDTKSICMNHMKDQPSIDFMGMISVKVIQSCVEEKQ